MKKETKLIDMEDVSDSSQDELDESYEALEKAVEENRTRGGNKPDFRIVQPTLDKEGKESLTSVGAMWKNVSKNGNVFYTLKIGDLKLLVFPNK
ncbi:DUF736 domain-containing protein [Candidatus Micrarchaeota archaeon]|jgi:uncharacterized protein (DUF736 family)|nr:DUF736 domain-containing protein [Candidatus Micrarchaeota archaeon]